jgi:hypothetical protein
VPDGEFRKNSNRDDTGSNSPGPAAKGRKFHEKSFPAATEVVDDDKPTPSEEAVKATENRAT